MFHRVQNIIIAMLVGFVLAALGAFALVQYRDLRVRQHTLRQRAEEEYATASRVLELKGTLLESFTYDYTYWDEMVSFVRTGDRVWARQMLDEALGTYQANAVWVYRTDWTTVYSVNNLQQDSLENLGISSPEQLFSKEAFCHFFVQTPAGLMEIQGASIHPTDDPERKTAPRGYFLAGRLWDDAYVAELGRLTSTLTALRPATLRRQPQVASDYRNSMIRMAQVLPDWNQRPLMQLTMEKRASDLDALRRTAAGTMGFLSGFATILFILLIYSLVHWVTRPLKLISRGLTADDPNVVEPLSHGQTEFGKIARLIREYVAQKVLLLKEIEQRKRAETELEAANRERQRVLDLALQHDFGTPMTVMQGYLDMLADGSLGVLNADQRTAVEHIAGSYHKLSEVRGQILNASALESGSIPLKREETNLGDLLRDGAAEVRLLADARKASLTIDAPAVNCVCDRNWMKQALVNCMVSLVKYAGAGARIVVTARNADGMLEITVADAGGNSTPGHALRLATGIELALTRAIVAAHGGKVETSDDQAPRPVIRLTMPASSPPVSPPVPVPD
jgi:signal transduction histidine kinase